MKRNTCGLHLSNRVRRFALYVDQHQIWERLIMIMISINCLQLMLMRPYAKCCDLNQGPCSRPAGLLRPGQAQAVVRTSPRPDGSVKQNGES